MRIQSAEFVKSVVDLADLPVGGMPEIAWAGRSNVGKSSLINALTGKKGLARTSNTPGKTRELNFYSVDSSWYLVDLPGYGFAAGSEADRIRWQAMIEPYLARRSQLCGVAVLVDSRVGATGLDETMIQWLADHGKPFAVMISKADRISESQCTDLARVLSGSVPEGTPVLVTSSKRGRGIRETETWITDCLKRFVRIAPIQASWQKKSLE